MTKKDQKRSEDLQVDQESNSMTAPTEETPPWTPPNGGWIAWLQVACSFCLYFVTWGTLQSFGVFQAYYKLVLLPGESTSKIAWIGSVQSFLVLFVGIGCGRLYDKGYLYALNAVGAVLIILGTMTISAATKYWQIFLAQGVAVGIGGGCLFSSSTAVVPAYFTTKRPLAMGLASLGSGIGGIIYPIVFHQLQPSVGFPWAVRTMAFITIPILLLPALCMRTPPLAGQDARRLQHAGGFFRDPVFACTVAAALVALAGLLVPLYLVQLFAQRRLGAGDKLVFYLIPIMNTGSTLGRLVFSALAAKLGPLAISSFVMTASGVVCLAWIAVDTVAGGVAFAFWYGAVSGAVFSLQVIVMAYITPNPKELGMRLGIMCGVGALGLLCGNPVAGALVDVREGSFVRAQVFGGVVLLGAGALQCASMAFHMRSRKKKRDGIRIVHG